MAISKAIVPAQDCHGRKRPRNDRIGSAYNSSINRNLHVGMGAIGHSPKKHLLLQKNRSYDLKFTWIYDNMIMNHYGLLRQVDFRPMQADGDVGSRVFATPDSSVREPLWRRDSQIPFARRTL